MKSISTKALIRKVRNDLDWPTLERSHDMPVIRIVSNPVNRTHIILLPDKLHNRSTDLDYLHELGHAYFCEKVHPVFAASSQFAPKENKRDFLMIIPALNSACDWFIGRWQLEISPRKTREKLKEHLQLAEEVVSDSHPPPLDIILDASLVIAQAIHYLQEPIDCGGPLKTAVDAFLSVPPEQPTVDNCVLLVNRLMATYTNQRARLIRDGDHFVWEVLRNDEVTVPKGPAPEQLSAAP